MLKVTYTFFALFLSAEPVAVAPATTVVEILAASSGDVKVPAGDEGLAHPGVCWFKALL